MQSLSDSFNDGPKSNWVMHEHRPELENILPQQGDGHTQMNAESCCQAFPSPDYYYAEEDISLIRSYSLSDDHNNWHALCGAAEPIMSPAEFSDGCKADLFENYNGETANNLSNDFIQPKSLKRPYLSNIPASNDANAEGVDGWVKRHRSLALGE